MIPILRVDFNSVSASGLWYTSLGGTDWMTGERVLCEDADGNSRQGTIDHVLGATVYVVPDMETWEDA